jgi:hypothetical protein
MSAKKKEDSQRRSQTAATEETVTVEVINQPLYEEGARREKGDRFQLTAARAEGLRHFVRIITP